MTNEVTGTSGFNFMHKDDVRFAMIALRHSKYHYIRYKLIVIYKASVLNDFLFTKRTIGPTSERVA